MINLSYQYECKADAKGRIKLPTGLKTELADVWNDGFIIKRSTFGKCLEFYPSSVWNQELAKINKLNRYKAKNVRFMRSFLTGVKQANPDANDRVLIPKELMEVAGLSKEVVLAPLIDRLEIWDKKTYEEMIRSMSNEEYQELAEDVMQNIDPDQE
jgi:MraZ protein